MVYFVSTPIGNLKDITLRAIEVLREVNIIACEDTRHSLKLLNHYGIKNRLISFHKFNESESAQKIISLCKEGKTIAVISDAGTPLISDPGGALVSDLIENGIDFTVIPGANAFVPALILSGLPSDSFTFVGFLKGRASHKQKQAAVYKNFPSTLIFYSAPQDVDKDIEILHAALGDRRAVLVKEITKIYESRFSFNLKDGANGEKKGEYVIVVEGAQQSADNELSPKEHILYYMEKGFDKKTALKMAAKDRNVPKSKLYKETLDIKDKLN